MEQNYISALLSDSESLETANTNLNETKNINSHSSVNRIISVEDFVSHNDVVNEIENVVDFKNTSNKTELELMLNTILDAKLNKNLNEVPHDSFKKLCEGFVQEFSLIACDLKNSMEKIIILNEFSSSNESNLKEIKAYLKEILNELQSEKTA
ncbi:hypothetical protein FF38_01955 [Lucilia cuprina]|uniref:Uncharacterized protein n=1 Tax=Lucilia cuprina TaxID=7375 RepID=A0A0L0CQT1_LUCCU|nr:hypothetical protein FF38_01955 [Lucilia cuprina]